jgi:Tol biopolymer transport system component
MRRASTALSVAILVVALAACGQGSDDLPQLVDAAVSPDGRLVAYAARDGDDLDLFVVRADGGRPRLVAGSARSEQSPVWSPDSTRLAYLVGDGYTYGGPGELWVAHAAGGRRIRLTAMASRDAEWSPDGRRVAFASAERLDEVEGSGGRLFVVGADGARLRRVARDLHGDRPRWSPDGFLIAFWSGRFDDDEFRDRGDIYAVDVRTDRVQRLTRRNDVGSYTAQWTRQRTILFTRELDLTTAIVETADARTGRIRRLRGPSLLWGHAIWSPDGRRILVDAGDGLDVLRLDGSARQRVDRRVMTSGHTWSPDGRLIAYDTFGGLYEPVPTDVVIASLGRPRARNVTRTPESSETVAGWLADSRHVVVVRDERSLWVFDLAGRGRRLVPVAAR